MYSLTSRNVNTAYPELLDMLNNEGEYAKSRNGPVIMLPAPLLLEIQRPMERVLYDTQRHANPFFHLMEGLWMLAGRQDVAFVSQFNQNMKSYSDDGKTYNAAYGHRWRKHFGYDQIAQTCYMLRNNPEDRRCVIAMWDGHEDLGAVSKDLPCNTTITCRIFKGKLDFIITNRSNDLVFGLMGANAVHMSMLQEYMAHCIGVPVGRWWHMTANLHIYEQHWPLLESTRHPDRWAVYPDSVPLVSDQVAFDMDCSLLCGGAVNSLVEPFMQHVAAPMYRAWQAWKHDAPHNALEKCEDIQADDWRLACTQWILRAMGKRDA